MAIFLGKPTSENLISGMSVGAPTIIRPATPDPSKFNAFYIVYDRVLANYRLDFIQEIHPGDVITLKAGEDVAANYVGTPEENPDLTFQHWSCPIEQINGTITMPSRVDCDVYIGAVYTPTDGLTHVINDKFGEPRRLYLCNASVPFYVKDKHSYKIVMPDAGSWDNQPCFSSDNMEFFIQPQGRQWTPVIYGGKRFKYYVIPYGVQYAPEIKGCRYAESLWLPDNLKAIGGIDRFTYSCFRKLHLPSSLEELNNYPFDCQLASSESTTATDRIIIDSNVTDIPGAAFRLQKANIFALASNITHIGFETIKSAKLAVIICNASTPPTLDGASNVDYTKRVYVPVGSIPDYEAADNWASYAGKFIEYTRANCEANGDEYIELR